MARARLGHDNRRLGDGRQHPLAKTLEDFPGPGLVGEGLDRGQTVRLTRVLLDHPKARLAAKDDVEPAVFEAIESGEVSFLREALQAAEVDIDEINDYHDGMTPLLLALYQRDLAMTRLPHFPTGT